MCKTIAIDRPMTSAIALLNYSMIESTETATEDAIADADKPFEPTETISESTADLLSEELGDEEAEFQPIRPSKTLIVAILMLAMTIGISCSAAVTLWSLSDHQASPEHTATK
jgi:hypothetical protein